MINPWHKSLADSARSVSQLVDAGIVSKRDAGPLVQVADRYKVQVSQHYLSLIDPDDPNCPIRLQAIPAIDELNTQSWEMSDPIGDKAHSPTRLLVHRYPGKALLFPTLLCPMYCRYCFRKSTLNGESLRVASGLDDAFTYLKTHPEITEVILTGGDPLSLSDRQLGRILERLWSLDGIERVRIHSRFLVTMPERFTDELLERLVGPKPVVLVTHFNHWRELTPATQLIVDRLNKVGVLVGNQSVLLRGVNDDPQTLVRLNQELVQAGIGPYYLHHLDAAPGTDHFRVSLDMGLEIYRAFLKEVPNVWAPKYVLDIPGGFGKVALNSESARRVDDMGHWVFVSPLTGGLVPWADPSFLGRQSQSTTERPAQLRSAEAEGIMS